MRVAVPIVLLVIAAALVLVWTGAAPHPDGPKRGDPPLTVPRPGEGPPADSGPGVAAPAPTLLLAEGIGIIEVHVLRNGMPAAARVAVFRAPHPALRILCLRVGERPELPLLATLETNASGRCEFRGLPADSLRFRATAADGATASRHWAVYRGILRLELEPRSQVLMGRARYVDGRPFSGWVDAGEAPRVRTNEDGTFRLRGLSVGEVTLTLVDPGRLSAIRKVVLPRDDELLVVVDEGFVPLEGRVVAAEDDRPIVDAEVRVASESEVSARTDTDGRFRVAAPPAEDLRAFVTAKGYAPALLHLRRGTEIEVRLLRRCVVTGRVVDPSGRPVPGMTVSVQNRAYPREDARTAESGPDGRFTLPDLCPGDLTVSARGPGRVGEGVTKRVSGAVNQDIFEVRPGDTREIEIVVVRTGAIEGTVRGADGKPRAGVTVSAATPGTTWRGIDSAETTVTDRDGRFRLVSIVPGFPYEVTALPPTGAPVRKGPVTVESGGVVTVDLEFAPERWIDLTVLMEGTGLPVAMAGVTVWCGDSEIHGQTGPDGTARIGPLPDGHATVRVDHGDCLCSRVAVPVPAGQDRLLIEMPPALSIAGRVTEGGEPPRGDLSVTVVDPERALRDYEVLATVAVAKDGAFRLGPLPAGTYEILFLERGSPRRERLRYRVEAGTHDLVLELPPAERGPEPEREERPDHGVLTVRWVGPDGRPAVGGRVRCHHEEARRPLEKIQENPGQARYRIRALGVSVRIEVWGATTGVGKPLGAVIHGPVRTEPGEILVRLPAARTIEGRVLDEEGRGVRGLTVRARRSPAGEIRAQIGHGAAKTLEGGRFSIAGLGEFSYSLTLTPPPGYLAPDPLEARAGTGGVVLALRRSASLLVRVLTPGGEPFSGARVIAVRRADRNSAVRANSGEDGVATLERLDPDREYDIRIDGAGEGWAFFAERVRPGSGPILARLAPGRTIRGRFEVPEKPSRFEVHARLDGSWIDGVVDREGTFTIRGLGPGRWQVSLFASSRDRRSWAGQAEVAAGGEVTISLSERRER